MKIRILYVEDEVHLGKIVHETLEKQGFEVLWETDGEKVTDLAGEFGPDICVLDIMLPNVNGYTLCKRITDLYPEMPVIFLTAKVETADLVRGFEAGGSDYMRKPFSIEELIVRIKNQLTLRKGARPESKKEEEIIQLGKYLFKPSLYELHAPSGIIQLSQRDMQILTILSSSLNRMTDRRDLLLSVWGDDSFFNSRNLDVYIRKLRDLLKEDSSIEIKTIKGKGYLFLVKA